MQAGADYQNRVAAWFAAKMLAERDAQPITPPGAVAYLRSETREAIDDLLVATDLDNFAFIQAKRSLSFSGLPTSELASVFAQCVRQFLHPEEENLRPWSRKLHPSRDRFLLVTSPDASEQVRKDLNTVLERVSLLAPQQVMQDAAHTAKEKIALAAAIEHVRREWNAETGNEPTPDQVKSLLSLLRIVTLDVEAGGVHEREAIGDLRAHVLLDGTQERSAWTHIIALCKQTAIVRLGINLAQLRSKLQADHIKLLHERAFRSDILKLQRHTTDSLALLDENSAIKLPSRNLKVHRDIVSILDATKPLPSLVVVGPPGAGKSGVLYDLALHLSQGGNDVVCIAVDRLELTSAARLREELSLSSTLIDVLKHWDGEQPGYLIIDAFDAARGDTAASTLLELIQQAQSTDRWKVIVSVRKYDLRYSPRLRKLFPYGGHLAFGPLHTDSEFSFINHVKVDAFTSAEFNQCCAQWDALEALKTAAPPNLLQLLYIPFNLRLAAELLDSGRVPEDFSGLQGQTGLLKAYWQCRVESGTGSGLRERALRQCVDSMVSARRLRTDRQNITESAEALEQLLKANVLSEWQASPTTQPTRQLLSFSHNLLFDFAAEQAYLPYDPEAFVSLLTSDLDLAIVLRPSLHMRFQLLWDTNRDDFWSQTFRFCSSSALSPLTQSVPLTVVAESASVHTDVKPLSLALIDPTSADHKGASVAYRHLVGILIADRPENLSNLGHAAGPWSALAEDATQTPEFDQIANALSWIESSLITWDGRTAAQAKSVGLVARRILSFAWAASNRNGPLVTAGVRAVCRTFGTNPVESASLLRQAFVPAHLQKFGYEELQWIVRSIASFLSTDPIFVVDLYVAAFSWQEEAEDDTALGSPSQIVGFKSNKRQDYQHALWELNQKFPSVLMLDLETVTNMVIKVVSAHSIRDHHATGQTEFFDIDGIPSGLLTDYSGIWVDHYGSFGSEPVSMLHSYFRHLDEDVLANGAPLPRPIFELLVGSGHVGVLWRKLLGLALKNEVLLNQLRSAAWAKPLLVGYDTERLMFRFLQAAYPRLADAEKVLVENTIMDLPYRVRGGIFGRETRDRFLGALEGNVLQTARAKRHQTILRNAKRLRVDPLEESRITAGAMRSPPPELVYGWRGVNTQEPQNRRAIELQDPLRAFNSEDMNVNSVPTADEALAVLPDMERMWCALGDEWPSQINPDVLHESFALLIQTASKAAQVPDLMSYRTLAVFIERVLLTGSATLWPEMDEEKNAIFDGHGSWGSPSGRVEAAEGLMFYVVDQHQYRLLHHPAFRAILNDSSALVRSRISSCLLRLYQTQPDEMWELIEHFATDKSTQVRKSVVLALSQLARPHPERALQMITEILDRADAAQPGADELRRIAVQNLVEYYIWRGDMTAQASVFTLVSNIPRTHIEAANMTFALRHGMMATAIEGRSEDEALAARERAVEVFSLIIDEVTDAVGPLLQKLSDKEEWNTEEGKTFQDMTKLASNLSQELYFAVGAFQEGRPYSAPQVESPEQVWLYRAINGRWDKLAEIGEAKIAHSLTQSLEMFISIDPEPIFLRVGAILKASKAWGYQYEQLGFDLVLRIFTTYLAEYPELFQQNPECLKIMRETLELFIGVGWVAARSLSYRLDELFR